MSNDSFSNQNTDGSNNNSEYQDYFSGIETIAKGFDYYIKSFLFPLYALGLLALLLIIPLRFLILTDRMTNSESAYDTIGAIMSNPHPVIIISLIVLGIIVLIDAGIFYRAIYYLCKTPESVYPNAQKTILTSFFLWFIVVACILVQIFSPDLFRSYVPDSCYSMYLLVIAGLTSYSYFSFYSFLSAICINKLQKSANHTRFIVLFCCFYFAIIYIIKYQFIQNEKFADIPGILAFIPFIAFIIISIVYIVLVNKYYKKTKYLANMLNRTFNPTDFTGESLVKSSKAHRRKTYLEFLSIISPSNDVEDNSSEETNYVVPIIIFILVTIKFLFL